MEISSTSLGLDAWRMASERLEIREKLEWRSATNAPPPPEPSSRVELSEAAIDDLAESPEAGDDDGASLEPRLRLLRAVIEWLTGESLAVFDSRDLGVGRHDAGHRQSPEHSIGRPAVSHELELHYRESEFTRFEAEGVVKTRDGREIRFAVQIEMRREFEIQINSRLRAGNPERKDPLVVNFEGAAADLADQRFRLDIDLDGQIDEARFVSAGSGILVFDRNGNGKVDDGSELFGAATGDGFAELAALDKDANGWVDGGDTAFGRLRIWRLGADGAPMLQALDGAGIGALSTHAVATPFSLRSPANSPLAQIVSSGVYLRETGSAGTLQQLDLFV